MRKLEKLIDENFDVIDPNITFGQLLEKYDVGHVMHYFDSVYTAEYGSTMETLGA